MANGHGGYRKPASPAPASGPGALSKRTDSSQPMRAPTGMDYGDHKALMAQESTAPMAQTPSAPQLDIPASPQGGGAGYQGPGMGDPSIRPDEPITHGVDIGPGAGPEALGQAPAGEQPDGYLTSLLGRLSDSDTTGTLAQLYLIAQQRGV